MSLEAIAARPPTGHAAESRTTTGTADPDKSSLPPRLPRNSVNLQAVQNLKSLFDLNKSWAEKIRAADPSFFEKLSQQQSPEYLWIGCADSRVPANEIVGLLPGEMFVHRNIANIVVHTDLNCLSVIQFAVDMLKVKHIMVVGHYGCSGVGVALRCERVGLADNWLRHLQDVREKHDACLCGLPGFTERSARLCELNVVEQVVNVCQTTIVRDAWQRGQQLTVHGWIYGLRDGRLRDLDCTASGTEEATLKYRAAIQRLQTAGPELPL